MQGVMDRRVRVGIWDKRPLLWGEQMRKWPEVKVKVQGFSGEIVLCSSWSKGTWQPFTIIKMIKLFTDISDSLTAILWAEAYRN